MFTRGSVTKKKLSVPDLAKLDEKADPDWPKIECLEGAPFSVAVVPGGSTGEGLDGEPWSPTQYPALRFAAPVANPTTSGLLRNLAARSNRVKLGTSTGDGGEQQTLVVPVQWGLAEQGEGRHLAWQFLSASGGADARAWEVLPSSADGDGSVFRLEKRLTNFKTLQHNIRARAAKEAPHELTLRYTVWETKEVVDEELQDSSMVVDEGDPTKKLRVSALPRQKVKAFEITERHIYSLELDDPTQSQIARKVVVEVEEGPAAVGCCPRGSSPDCRESPSDLSRSFLEALASTGGTEEPEFPAHSISQFSATHSTTDIISRHTRFYDGVKEAEQFLEKQNLRIAAETLKRIVLPEKTAFQEEGANDGAPGVFLSKSRSSAASSTLLLRATLLRSYSERRDSFDAAPYGALAYTHKSSNAYRVPSAVSDILYPGSETRGQFTSVFHEKDYFRRLVTDSIDYKMRDFPDFLGPFQLPTVQGNVGPAETIYKQKKKGRTAELASYSHKVFVPSREAGLELRVEEDSTKNIHFDEIKVKIFWPDDMRKLVGRGTECCCCCIQRTSKSSSGVVA